MLFTAETQRRRDKLCLRRRRIEQAVTTRGGNSRPVGKPGDGKPGDRPGCPRGAKAAPWDTRVSPQVCDIALRENSERGSHRPAQRTHMKLRLSSREIGR